VEIVRGEHVADEAPHFFRVFNDQDKTHRASPGWG
jgi:hypothetical protein